MKCFFLLILLCCCSSIHAQKYLLKDSIVLKYPSKIQSTRELVDLIKRDFNSEAWRARAVYTWMIHNIDYDINEVNFYDKLYDEFVIRTVQDSFKVEEQVNSKISRRVLSTKKAVCSGYSVLYKKLCNELNISCEVVSGMGKNMLEDINSEFISNHDWNLVTIDKKRYLIDVTWGTGYLNSEKYTTYYFFLTPPELFILDHYPDASEKSLLPNPISTNDFLRAPLYHWTEGKRKLKCIQPKSGLLTRSKSDKIDFTFYSDNLIKSVSIQIGHKWFYPKIKQLKNNYSFSLDISGLWTSKKLIVFVDNEACLTYKIKK